MSIISAGTSTTNALVQTGDTNGNLVFKTNNGTTALTLGTDQSATFSGAVSATTGDFSGAVSATTGDFSGVVTFGAAGLETKVAMAANDIDLSAGNYFTKTISATTTFTVSNVPTSGTVASFILVLTNAGSQTINWSTSFGGSNLIKWAGGTAPTLTASGVDSLGFYTFNGGTTWTGLVLGKDIK